MKIKFTVLLFLIYTINFSQFRSGADPTLGNSKMENGSIGISYELYGISNNAIKVPVTLYYSGSKGIKVNEMYSSVGLGWNLGAGGNISRFIQGYPDDENKGQEKKEGILFNNNMSSAESLNLTSVNNTQINDLVKKDYEPDLFFINLPNVGGTFFFDKSKTIKCLNKNIKISYTQDNSSGNINSFTIVDEVGIRYVFDKKSRITETTKFENAKIELENPEDAVRSYTTSWSLSSITDLNGNSVLFSYRSETKRYRVSKIEKKSIKKLSSNAVTVNDYDYNGWTDIEENNNLVETITSSKGDNLKFNYQLTSDNSGALRIYNLTINNKTRYDFVQDYFKSGSDQDLSEGNIRLRLDKVTLNDKLFLSFTYDSKILPRRGSSEQDYWGYYNKNGAQSLIPKIYIDQNAAKSKSFVNYGFDNFNENQYIILDGADRRSNINTEACILRSITNKWGGTETFEYELNTFFSDNKRITGNGLRIKWIEYKDANSTYRTNYDYNENSGLSSGKVISLPKFSYVLPGSSIRYVINNDGYYYETENGKYRLYGNLSLLRDGDSNWSTQDKYYYTTQVFSTQQNNILGDFEVNYSQINETSSFFEGIRKRYYDVPYFVDNLSSQIMKYFTWDGSTTYTDFTNNTDTGGLPFKPTTILNKNRKTLRKEETYSKQNNIVSITESSFSDINKNDKTILLKYSSAMIKNPYFLLLPVTPYMENGGFLTKYNLYEDIDKTLSSTTNTDYLNGQTYNTFKSFEYNSRNYVSKETWTDSEGYSNEKRIKYACDFSITGTPPGGSQMEAVKFMNDNNILNFPIETVFLRNGKVISGEINIYKKFGNSVQPVEKKSLEVDNINTDYLYASISSSNFSIDSRYDTKEYYDLYDSYGNLVQKHIPNGIYTSYLYGYTAKYNLATLDNVQYASIPSNIISTVSTSTDETILRNQFSQLRLQFPDAKIISKTYLEFVGKNSETDEKGTTTFYEYDDRLRLIRTRNDDNNITKETEYISKGDYFYNIEMNSTFYKNCGDYGIGSAYTYTVPARKYTSTISQSDANQKAMNEISANGQNTANSLGTCTQINCSLTVSPFNGGGSITVANNSYKVFISFGTGPNSTSLPWTTTPGVKVATIQGSCRPSKKVDGYNGQVYYTIETNGDIYLRSQNGAFPNNTTKQYELYYQIN